MIVVVDVDQNEISEPSMTQSDGYEVSENIDRAIALLSEKAPNRQLLVTMVSSKEELQSLIASIDGAETFNYIVIAARPRRDITLAHLLSHFALAS